MGRPRYFIRDLRARDQFCVEQIDGPCFVLSLAEIIGDDHIMGGLVERDQRYIKGLLAESHRII